MTPPEEFASLSARLKDAISSEIVLQLDASQVLSKVWWKRGLGGRGSNLPTAIEDDAAWAKVVAFLLQECLQAGHEPPFVRQEFLMDLAARILQVLTLS